MNALVYAKQRSLKRQRVLYQNILDSLLRTGRYEYNKERRRHELVVRVNQDTLPFPYKTYPLKNILPLFQSLALRRFNLIVVKIPIGGKERTFTLKKFNNPRVNGQIKVGTRKSDYKGFSVKDDYNSLAEVLDKNSKRNAWAIKKALNDPLHNQPNFTKRGLTSKEINAVVKLIAITHISEGASSRAPGMDKYFRSGDILKKITKGQASFSDIFNSRNGQYIPSWSKRDSYQGLGGTQAARLAVQGKSPQRINVDSMSRSSSVVSLSSVDFLQEL